MPDQPAPAPRRAWIKLAILVLVLGAAFVAARVGGLFEADAAARAAERIRDIPRTPLTAGGFVLAYAVIASFGLPATIMTLAGGAIFGFGLGSLLNWAGASLGAVGAYLLARTLGTEAVRRLLRGSAGVLDRVTARHGFASVLRLRLLPVVPFNAFSFACGLAGVQLRGYALGTTLGIIPGTLVYTYFADALLTGAGEARGAAFTRVAIAGVLLVALSFLPRLFARGDPDAAAGTT